MTVDFRAAFATTPRPGTLTLSRWFRQPPEKLWAALTTPERFCTWMGAEWLPAGPPRGAGSDFSFRLLPHGLESHGAILAWNPPHILEHGFFENLPPGSAVRWSLQPENTGTRLTLKHIFRAPDDAPRAATGWTTLITRLADLLDETITTPLAWHSLRDSYAHDFPAEATRDGRKLDIDGAPALRFVRVIHHPAGAVWRALTEPAAIKRWLQADATIDAKPSGRFHLTLNGAAAPMPSTITQWNPPHLLEYTWPEALAGGDSLVRFEITPLPAGSILTFTHVLRAGGDLADFGSGWHWHLDALDDALDGTAREFDRPMWAALRMVYGMIL
jgi:uncharacterized protein YndB with AHSA1/START domain